jgi:hypothetical protein
MFNGTPIPPKEMLRKQVRQFRDELVWARDAVSTGGQPPAGFHVQVDGLLDSISRAGLPCSEQCSVYRQNLQDHANAKWDLPTIDRVLDRFDDAIRELGGLAPFFPWDLPALAPGALFNLVLLSWEAIDSGPGLEPRELVLSTPAPAPAPAASSSSGRSPAPPRPGSSRRLARGPVSEIHSPGHFLRETHPETTNGLLYHPP